MIHRFRGIDRERREEGQIIPALLLVVVALIFFSLLFVQVGSASEQKTQTQTAADSAAVSAAHSMRDFSIVSASAPLASRWESLSYFLGVRIANPDLQSVACDAAQTNWNANPHKGMSLDCGLLATYPVSGGVRVDLTAAPDQVVDGPAKVQDQRAKADATADVVLDRCSRLPDKYQKDVADFLIDSALLAIGSSSHCSTPDEQGELDDLQDGSFGIGTYAAVGPPQPIFDAVRASLRTELTDD